MIAIAYVLLCLIWGSTWMFIKIGLDYFSPVTFAAVRFVLTAVLMFTVLLITKKLSFIKDLNSLPAIIFGIFNGISYALVFEGESRITSSLTAVLNAVLPFFTLILAAIFVNEKISLRKAVGLIFGFSGILFLYWNDLSQTTPQAILGGIMIILSTLTYSTGSIFTKKYKSDIGVMETVTTQMAVSGLVLALLAIIIEPLPKLVWNYTGVFALLYLSVIGSAVAFVLYYYLIKNIEVSKLSYVSMLTPVIAIFFGVVFLGESFSLSYVWTLLAVLIGMYVITS